MPSRNIYDLLYIRPHHKGVKYLYWSQLLKKMGERLVNPFVPMFLYGLGMEMWGDWKKALTLVFLYYFSFRLLYLVFIMPVAQAIRRFGYRWSALGGSWLFVASYMLMSYAEKNVWLLVGSVSTFALGVPMYWLAYNTLFTEEADVDHYGSEMSWIAIIERVIAVLGPLVGAVVASLWGYRYLFWLGVLAAALMSVPLFYLRHHTHADMVSWGELLEWLREKRFRLASLSFVGKYVYDAMTGVGWPLYVFLLLDGDVERVGQLLSMVMLVSVVVVWLSGKLFDKKHSKGMFAVGSVITAVMWVVRGFLTTFKQILIVDGADKVNSVFYWLPYNAYLFIRAKGREAFSFMVYREVFVALGGLLFWGGAMVLVWVWWDWRILFGVAAWGVMASQFILDRSSKV